MLFNSLLSSLNKVVELVLPTNKLEDYNNDDDSSLDEKKSVNISFRKPRRTGSNRSLFKLSMKKNWSFSNTSISSTATIVTPPSPTQVAPLWKDKVDSDVKNELHSSEIHRQEIMFEIIRTENSFVDDIKYLQNVGLSFDLLSLHVLHDFT
jgi:hypothetical protein